MNLWLENESNEKLTKVGLLTGRLPLRIASDLRVVQIDFIAGSREQEMVIKTDKPAYVKGNWVFEEKG